MLSNTLNEQKGTRVWPKRA